MFWAIMFRAAPVNSTEIEKEAREALILKRMAEAGMTRENCRLKAKRVQGGGKSTADYPTIPDPYFPYKWDFNDGTLCGINQVSKDIKNMRVQDGKLQFSTTGNDAFFSWGNYDETKPALRFGYGPGTSRVRPRMKYVEMRIKQSLPESDWKITHKAADKRGRILFVESKPLKLKGTSWQTRTFNLPGNLPPYAAFRVISTTPGNSVEIDGIRPLAQKRPNAFRKGLELPAAVRWARISTTAYSFQCYVNGQKAAGSLCPSRGQGIWNYELDPKLFRKGRNAIGFECLTPIVLLDGALLCEDGTYIRFDTDETWKCQRSSEDRSWTQADYDDSDWSPCSTMQWAYLHVPLPQPLDMPDRQWFNPSHKGPIMVTPADGRSQPVFGARDDVVLRVAVPAKGTTEPRVTYELLDEMGDGFHAQDKLVVKGTLTLERLGLDHVGELSFADGEVKRNRAYAVTLHLIEDGTEIEKRRYEIAVCGPIDQPIVENPTHYTDGMKLKLVWEKDTTEEQDAADFISMICRASSRVVDSHPRKSQVIKTPLGKFRRTHNKLNEQRAWMSWKYRIRHPGRPHVAIAEYPSDTERVQELRITEETVGGSREIGNDAVAIGYANPLQNKVCHHHVVFFPSAEIGAISIMAPGKTGGETAARVGKIGIYEILNDIPMRKITDAEGPTKWYGQVCERGLKQAMQSCFASPAASLLRKQMILSDVPNFYRNWTLTFANMVRRMRFAGENAYFLGSHMYVGPLFPSKYSFSNNFGGTYSGSFCDAGVLMARMFEENGLGVFSAFEITSLPALHLSGSDDDVARGCPTTAQVDKKGRQLNTYGYVRPNYIHPDVRKHFDAEIDELIDLYGEEKGWKGIALLIHDAYGPSWSCVENDPWSTSYDDTTTGLFEKETGVEIPVDGADLERFGKRYDWLMAHAKDEWTDWRCRKMNEIYKRVSDRLKQARKDLSLIVYAAPSYMTPGPGEEKRPDVLDYARRGGLDIKWLQNDPDIVFAGSPGVSGTARDRANRYRVRLDDSLQRFANDGHSGLVNWNGWYEMQLYAPEGWVFSVSSPEGWPFSEGNFWHESFTMGFLKTNPSLVLHPLQDAIMWNGREPASARFADAFRSIPNVVCERLSGKGRDKNIWIATARHGHDIVGYAANMQGWEQDAKLAFSSGAEIYDLVEEKPIRGNTWSLRMMPYGLYTFRVRNCDNPENAVESCTVTVPEAAGQRVRDLIAEAETVLSEKHEVLNDAGTAGMINDMLVKARAAMAEGDVSTANDWMTSAPGADEIEKRNWREPGYTPKLMTAPLAAGAVTIDGKLDEWKGLPSQAINSIDQVWTCARDMKVWWTGEDDCSSEFKVQWDQHNLYLAVVVRDNHMEFGLRGADSVEVYFDGDILQDFGERRFNLDDHDLKMAPPAKEGDPVRLMFSRGDAQGKKRFETPRSGERGIKMASTRNDTHYTIEACMPWKELRDKPVETGTTIGFDVMVIDRDEGITKQSMWWSAPRQAWGDVRLFGRLQLGDAEGNLP